MQRCPAIDRSPGSRFFQITTEGLRSGDMTDRIWRKFLRISRTRKPERTRRSNHPTHGIRREFQRRYNLVGTLGSDRTELQLSVSRKATTKNTLNAIMCHWANSFFVVGNASVPPFHSRGVSRPLLLASLVFFCTSTTSLTGCEKAQPRTVACGGP